MRKIYILLIIGFFISSFPLHAQVLKKADKYFESFYYHEAIELYEILWQRDSLNESLTKKVADSYRLINNTEQAEQWYARVVKMLGAKNNDFLYYAKALQSNKKYNEAQIWMNKYLESESISELNDIDPIYISDLMQDSIRYKVQAINANSEASDFGVSFYKNQSVFSSARNKTTFIKRTFKWSNQNYLRLYEANIDADGELVETHLFSKELETNYHDGPVCFNTEGDEMFLTRNYISNTKRLKRNQDGTVTLMLYHSKKDGNKWSEPELLPFNMEGYSTGHPALSADAKSLYFISDRPGGLGGTDLYVCHRKENRWGKAENLGPQINTSENEMFPFVTKSQILYFASKGYAGLGGLDIFSIDLNQKGMKPINLGYPVNTSKDDFGLILKNGKGYFASNRLKGQSFDDIYKFSIESRLIRGQVFNKVTNEILGHTLVTLNDENGHPVDTVITKENGVFKFFVSGKQAYQIRSEKESFIDGNVIIKASDIQDKTEFFMPVFQAVDNTILLEGLVVMKDEQCPIEGMIITVINQKTLDSFELVSDVNGKFLCKLDKGGIYNLEYHKTGIMSRYDMIDLTNSVKNRLFIKEEFNQLEIGKSFVLENILYDFNKSNIREDASIELDKLVAILRDNPHVMIELSSHTDSRGSFDYNMILSKRRAKEAVDYILSKGITSERIVSKAYGEIKLINRCEDGVECSKAEHQANRRTEVKVLEL